jgi:hypothetical protein
VAAVIDPISEEAQVWSSLLKTACEMDNVAVSVYLEPDTQNTEVCFKFATDSDLLDQAQAVLSVFHPERTVIQ